MQAEKLSSGQFAASLGVTATTVSRWERKGLLQGCIRLAGRRLRIPRSELERVLREGLIAPSSPAAADAIGAQPELRATA
jgi:hypothetical protein